MNTYIRFERGCDGVIGPTYGPYDFIQVSSDVVRASSARDEIELAVFGEYDWHLVDAERDETVFSDFIIYAQ